MHNYNFIFRKASIKKLFILTLFTIMNAGISSGASRVEVLINDNWKFTKGNVTGAVNIVFDDSNWDRVNLPYSWNNLDGQYGSNYYRGPAWYRKTFKVSKEYTGKKIFINFGAANLKTDVYINGMFAGEHIGGYASFTFDVTGLLKTGGINTISVKVDNTPYKDSKDFQFAPLDGDFTMGGGLNRSVKLIITDSIHVSCLDYSSPGIYISQNKVDDNNADISLTAKLTNDSKEPRNISVGTVIYNSEGKVVKELSDNVELLPSGTLDFKKDFSIANPHLWNGRIDPYLYKVVFSVYKKNILLDRVEQPMGLRYYKVDPEKGFFLNGKPYKLHGFCMHEDKENKGRALSDADREEEVNCMMDIGATIVRMAHYQHAEKEYELCDKDGIVVWTELPLVDCISTEKSFADNCKQQLTELIRQNFNHPSIFFWSLFNEIDLVKGPDPLSLVKELNELAKKEDPSRYTTAASYDNNQPASFVTDVLGLNKYFGWYGGKTPELGKYLDDWHKQHPDRAIGISEYGAGGSTLQHEEVLFKPETNSHWHPEEYQTDYHEVSWKIIQERPYLWFSTLWVLFDFSSGHRDEGFRAGINDKGIIEQDHTTKKDSYYWYKVNWNPDPMIHITSKKFTMRDTSVVSVKVYSNAEELELFVNKKSVCKMNAEDHRFIWNGVKLNQGINSVKAIASFNGKELFDECWWNCSK
ncbi:MAG: glycoside hydrolase family 2 TIM barrel-domain containing protein [Ignavibacteriaceae bacterium]